MRKKLLLSKHAFIIHLYLVTQLQRYTELEIENACLAAVLQFCACLTNIGTLKAHTLAWAPAENGERSRTDLALSAVLVFHHTYVRILAEACLTQNGKV